MMSLLLGKIDLLHGLPKLTSDLLAAGHLTLLYLAYISLLIPWLSAIAAISIRSARRGGFVSCLRLRWPLG